jgi:hypothetical protein
MNTRSQASGSSQSTSETPEQEYQRLADRWRVGAASPAEISRLRELTGPESILGMVLAEDGDQP